MPDIAIDLHSQSNSIKRLLGESFFIVRPPQRRFKWDTPQIKQLWSDIEEAFNSKRKSYFIGTIMVQADDAGLSVIDGQQRLTAMSLLLAAIRDACSGLGLEDRASNIHKLIVRLDLDNKPVGDLSVTLQKPDQQVFEYMVRDKGSTEREKPDFRNASDRVFPATAKFTEYLKNYLEYKNDRAEALRRFSDYVLENVRILPLQVENEAQAFLVFDTTNTRGLELSPSEALKARLAVVVREDPDASRVFIQQWNTAAHALEGAGLPIDSMDDYLLAIWSSKHGHVVKRNLSKAVISAIDKKEEQPASVASDIAKYVHSYLSVVKPTGVSELDEDLRDLGRLKVSQANGFLTMVHKHYPQRFAECVNAVLAVQIRNITIGKERANQYQSLWPGWAKLVKAKRLDEALRAIAAKLQSDSDFESHFNNGTVDSAGAARHILRKLDKALAPHAGMLPVDVDREHILPQSVFTKLLGDKTLTPNVRQWITDLGYSIPGDKDGRARLGTEIEKLTSKIGNQVLVHQTPNRATKDKPFESKRKGFKEMKLALTIEAGMKNFWTATEIRERQERLAKLAVGVWRL